MLIVLTKPTVIYKAFRLFVIITDINTLTMTIAAKFLFE